MLCVLGFPPDIYPSFHSFRIGSFPTKSSPNVCIRCNPHLFVRISCVICRVHKAGKLVNTFRYTFRFCFHCLFSFWKDEEVILEFLSFIVGRTVWKIVALPHRLIVVCDSYFGRTLSPRAGCFVKDF